MKKLFIWDLPLRVFHWILVVLVCVSFYTGLTGGLTLMDYHMWSGYAILTLIIFRIAWGFWGNHYARFGSFLYRPRQLVMAVRQLSDRTSEPYMGHNPLGGLSVIAFLVALLVQAGTGLFANDDIFTEGPLTHLVSDATSDQLTEIHETNLWVIGVLIGLHVAAVIFYETFKGQRLVIPMITGNKPAPDHMTQSPGMHDRPVRALILAALAASIVYSLVNWL